MSELKIGRGFSLPLDIVTEAIGIVATRGAGKSYTSAVVLEETHRAGVPFVVLDPSGVYHGLRSSADGDKPGLPVYVLGGPHGDVPLEDEAGRFTADIVVDSGHSFVLDLSDFTKTKMRKFVATFLERLYDRKARSRSTLLLVVDEADEFAPQKPRGDTINSLAAMETIAKRGRARGLGIVMITQRTQALNKDVLDLIETLIAMRQLAERSRESVKGWIADKELRDDAGIIESLQALPTGTAWVWSPLRGILEKVQIRRIRTFDSYATPKPGEVKAEPRARASLDLDALGEQMRSTIARAKENDPAELRRRVRDAERARDEARGQIEDLERALTERPPETVVVEKPIAIMEELDGAWKMVTEAREVGEKLTKAIEEVAQPLAAAIMAAVDAAAKPDETPAETPVDAVARRAVRVEAASNAAAAQTSNGHVDLGKGARAVLGVLAEYPEGRTKNELAFLAGYSARASTMRGILAELRKAGYVGTGEPVRATEAGLAAAGGVRERPTGRALLDQWLSHPRMGEGERKVLLALIDAGGELTHEELCERTGYSPDASTMRGILGDLRKLGLVEKGARRVAPEFMEAIA